MSDKIVSFGLARSRMMVGSWVEIPVEIDSRYDISLDQIDFIIPKGPAGGVVAPASGKRIVLCAGYLPGRYELFAVDKATRDKVFGKLPFEVVPVRDDNGCGPSLWFDGRIRGYVRGAAFGGGDAGPENIDITPHSGDWRVAILFADTADHRYPDDQATMQAFKNHWSAAAFSLAPGQPSAAQCFLETSYGQLTIKGDVFGPVHLPDNWNRYLSERTHVDPITGDTVHEDVWDPYPHVLAQACFTEADPLIDFRNYQSLVIVMPPTKPGSGVWPQAWGALAKTTEGDLGYSVLVMPNEWTRPHQTLAHELGHNLGLPDLYQPRVPPGSSDAGMQNLGAWDLMHADSNLPQMCALSRMAEGWLDGVHIKTYNFANQQPLPPVNEKVRLRALEIPPLAEPGVYSAIEIRLAAGHDYYVEYRCAQPGQLSDQGLPASPRVLVTDAALPSPGDTVPFARPRVMLVHKDSDGDGPVLGPGQDFRETDITSPALDPLRISVESCTAELAEVSVRYGPAGKPDPSIRPWPASPERQWQSPDIEIRNERSQAYPEWQNVPWEGQDNLVVARVTNRGSLDAPGVVVNFYLQSFDASGQTLGAPAFLGSDRHDVAAGKTVEFNTSWVPPDQGHRCVSVEIEQYNAPGTPPVPELSDRNNFAQSNYCKYISRSASPFSRQRITVGVNNPLNARARVLLVPRQTHPHFRTYLECTYLTLAPHERREIDVMTEYVPPADKGAATEHFRETNHLSVAAFIFAVEAGAADASPQLLGGVDIDVAAAIGTRFVHTECKEGRIRGALTAGDGSQLPNGNILLIESSVPRPWLDAIHPPATRQPPIKGSRMRHYRTVPLIGGRFEASVQRGHAVQAYYGGAPGYADCYSETIAAP